MGTIVEIFADEKGMLARVSRSVPVHLVRNTKRSETVKYADSLYEISKLQG